MSNKKPDVPVPDVSANVSAPAEVDAFLRQVSKVQGSQTSTGRRGRLIFALDATASRQPTWDRAAHIQARMFEETAVLGGLEIQLVFFRGFREFKVSPWLASAGDLNRMMTSVFCLAGETQIAKVLQHSLNQAREHSLNQARDEGGVNALIYVGDSMEEDIDRLGTLAGELGLLGVPAFMFHEGDDAVAAYGYQQIAKLSGGAFCRFDPNSPHVLKDLLAAVAVYAAGGRSALEKLAQSKGGNVLTIASQIAKGE